MERSITDLSFSVATPSILRHMVLTVCLAGVLAAGDLAGDASRLCCWLVRSFIGDLAASAGAAAAGAAPDCSTACSCVAMFWMSRPRALLPLRAAAFSGRLSSACRTATFGWCMHRKTSASSAVNTTSSLHARISFCH